MCRFASGALEPPERSTPADPRASTKASAKRHRQELLHISYVFAEILIPYDLASEWLIAHIYGAAVHFRKYVFKITIRPLRHDRHTRAYTMSPVATQRTHSIATMGADGIGPEVVQAGVQVLRKLADLDGTFKLAFQDYDWSSDTYKKTGKYIPDGGLEELKEHDAILFGAVGAPGSLHIDVATFPC